MTLGLHKETLQNLLEDDGRDVIGGAKGLPGCPDCDTIPPEEGGKKQCGGNCRPTKFPPAGTCKNKPKDEKPKE